MKRDLSTLSLAFKDPTMLLYDADSPAPRCLRMFLLEKGLVIPGVKVDVFTGENRAPPFLKLNPAGQTPALKLDDGQVLAEAVAIAEYLEELHPLPALIGRTAGERAETRQWWRRIELNVTEFIHNAYHYSEGLERFGVRIPVAAEAAAGMKRIAQNRIAWIDQLFGDRHWLCGERFSAADIWLYVWLDFGCTVNQPFDRNLPHLGPWFASVATRTSAARSRATLAASLTS